jgi:hypothetical protein
MAKKKLSASECCKILGIDKDKVSDKVFLKSLYNKLVKEHHPDIGGDEELFKNINEAYNTLNELDTYVEESEEVRKTVKYQYYVSNRKPNKNDIIISYPLTVEEINKGLTIRHTFTRMDRTMPSTVSEDFLIAPENMNQQGYFLYPNKGHNGTGYFIIKPTINDKDSIQLMESPDQTKYPDSSSIHKVTKKQIRENDIITIKTPQGDYKLTLKSDKSQVITNMGLKIAPNLFSNHIAVIDTDKW